MPKKWHRVFFQAKYVRTQQVGRAGEPFWLLNRRLSNFLGHVCMYNKYLLINTDKGVLIIQAGGACVCGEQKKLFRLIIP